MGKRKRKPQHGSFLDSYRRIRKPMPPPERIMGDRRREAEEDTARREIEEGESRRGDPGEP